MPLTLLNFPSVPNPTGSIISITNAKTGSSRGMNWSYKLQGGVVSAARTYTNTLRVITNNPLTGPIQIQNSLISVGCVQGAYYVSPLPEYQNGVISIPTGTFAEQDTGSFLHELDIKEETEDGKQWLCTFQYGPADINVELGSSQASLGVTNPLEMMPEVEWTPAIFEEFYPQDSNGIPFLNTVGDPIEDPPKREVSRQTLSFTRNEAQYNDAYAQQFRQTVNLYPFLGFATNQVKCKTITGKRIYSADWGLYWNVHYEFEMRVIDFSTPETYDPITGLGNGDGMPQFYGWEDLIQNQGFRRIDPVSGLVVPITIGTPPQLISAPMLLDQAGAPLTATASPLDPLPEPYYLIFMQYDQMDFTALNIPDTIFTEDQPSP
jgi:hypothetical protein